MSVLIYRAFPTDPGTKLRSPCVLYDEADSHFFGSGFENQGQASRFLNWCAHRSEDPREIETRGRWSEALMLFGESAQQERIYPLGWCRRPYCYEREARVSGEPSGWGLCREHADEDALAGAETREYDAHVAQCPGCDECHPGHDERHHGYPPMADLNDGGRR